MTTNNPSKTEQKPPIIFATKLSLPSTTRLANVLEMFYGQDSGIQIENKTGQVVVSYGGTIPIALLIGVISGIVATIYYDQFSQAEKDLEIITKILKGGQ